MGHYYADLMCDQCGQIRCRCPRKPEPPPTGFIVNSDYTVLPASEYIAATNKYGQGHLNYMFAKKHATRELAETAALASLDADIDAMEAQLVTLRELRKAMT